MEKEFNTSEIIPFDFHGKSIRTIKDTKGNPWFIAKDIAGILGYKRTRDAINQHCHYARILGSGNSPLPMGIKVIPESDVYRLIIGSKMPAAKKFEKWIMEEVLPSIRKHGGYVNNIDLFMDSFFKFASEEQKPVIRNLLENQMMMQKQLEEQKPKIEFYEALVNSGKSFDIGTTAKLLNFPGIGRNKVFKILRDEHILMEGGEKHNIPYQEYINRGWFRVSIQLRDNGIPYTKVFVFPKGMEAIRHILASD